MDTPEPDTTGPGPGQGEHPAGGDGAVTLPAGRQPEGQALAQGTRDTGQEQAKERGPTNHPVPGGHE